MSQQIILAKEIIQLTPEIIEQRKVELELFKQEMSAIDLLFGIKFEQYRTNASYAGLGPTLVAEKFEVQKKCAIKYGLM